MKIVNRKKYQKACVAEKRRSIREDPYKHAEYKLKEKNKWNRRKTLIQDLQIAKAEEYREREKVKKRKQREKKVSDERYNDQSLTFSQKCYSAKTGWSEATVS